MLTFIAMLTDDLRLLVESRPPLEWGRLGQHLPYEWIEYGCRPAAVPACVDVDYPRSRSYGW